jgi:probable Rubsico expression protein CbbX
MQDAHQTSGANFNPNADPNFNHYAKFDDSAEAVRARRMKEMDTFRKVRVVNLDSPEAGNYVLAEDRQFIQETKENKTKAEAHERDMKYKKIHAEKSERIAFLETIDEDQDMGELKDYMGDFGDIQEVLDKLDAELIGLREVKESIRELAAMLVVDKMRSSLGLKSGFPNLHMAFTGAPGTGKTTVAMRIGEILRSMGYCGNGHVVVAQKDDLVGRFVGHTAPKTTKLVKQSLGGVLFLDEAYYLYKANDPKDYGHECIEIISAFMEEHGNRMVVVIAGYKDKISRFLGYVPGFAAKIGVYLDFPDYEPEDMREIAKLMISSMSYEVGEEALDKMQEYLTARSLLPFFANARTVRNAVDVARMRQAIRLFYEAFEPGHDGGIEEGRLSVIEVEDIPTVEELADDPSAHFEGVGSKEYEEKMAALGLKVQAEDSSGYR